MPTTLEKERQLQDEIASQVEHDLPGVDVLAVELLTAARALDLRAPLRPAPATAAVVQALRATVQGPGPDRYLAPEIEAALQFVTSGAAVAATESVIGPMA